LIMNNKVSKRIKAKITQSSFLFFPTNTGGVIVWSDPLTAP
jgi:hypothetical protein